MGQVAIRLDEEDTKTQVLRVIEIIVNKIALRVSMHREVQQIRYSKKSGRFIVSFKIPPGKEEDAVIK